MGSRRMDHSPPPTGADGLVFRVLGPLELVGEDGRVRVLTGRQQMVLSMLLVRINRVVAVDQLVDALWETAPPATARAQIQFCVHALRQEIARLGIPAQIVTQAPGYRLEVEQSRVDWCRFRDTVARARELCGDGDRPGAVALLRQALQLWRGPVLAGTSDLLQEQISWLDELRVEVLEECLELELELGHHRELVGELRQLVAEHPLNETFRGSLMLALYRADRASDALEVYRAGRSLLIEELGLDPGEKLQQLQAAILAEDRSLLELNDVVTAPSQPPATGWWVTPKQLPRDIPDFTGRDDLITSLLGVLDQDGDGVGRRASTSIVNVTGKAGIGKSVLAVHIAHRVSGSYPDGQLYVNLGATQEQPAAPYCLLGTLLRALGVDGTAIPDTLADRAAAYRSLLAERSVLVVLEDAANEEQVLPLLPASARCAVVVTSRGPLAGLPGVHVEHVDVLNEDHGLKLLARLIGTSRVDREPAPARALVRAVGGLPLALRIVGARIAARPQWTVKSMLDRLADERRRLDELRYGEMAVRSSLMLSYTGLDLPAARLMGRLGLVNAESLPSWTAGAVLGEDGQRAYDPLDRLVDAQLLDAVLTETVGIPRYRFHDLIRIFACERQREHEPGVERDVLSRVLGGWLALAECAHRRLYGGDFTTLHSDVARWAAPSEHVNVVNADPLRWYEQERANIAAAVEHAAELGFDDLCWDLSVTLVSLFEVRSSFDDWLWSHETALRATRAAGNVRGTAALLCSLGSLHLTQNQLERARSVLRPAFESFVQLEDVLGIALVSRNLGLLDRRIGETDRARQHCLRAYDGFVEVGDAAGQGAVLCQIAQLDLDADDHARALEALRKALLITDGLASARVQSQVHYKMGKVLLALGDFDGAKRTMSTVLELVRDSGDLQGECYAMQLMGVIQMHRGMLTAAAKLLNDAVAGCGRNFDRVGAARCLLDLARVEQLRGHFGNARSLAGQASAVFAEYALMDWVDRANLMAEADQPDSCARPSYGDGHSDRPRCPGRKSGGRTPADGERHSLA